MAAVPHPQVCTMMETFSGFSSSPQSSLWVLSEVHREKPQSSYEFLLCLWPHEVIYSLTSLHSVFSNLLKILSKFYSPVGSAPVNKCLNLIAPRRYLSLFRFQVNWLPSDLSALMGSRKFLICILEFFMVVRVRMMLFPASYTVHRIQNPVSLIFTCVT